MLVPPSILYGRHHRRPGGLTGSRSAAEGQLGLLGLVEDLEAVKQGRVEVQSGHGSKQGGQAVRASSHGPGGATWRPT